VRKREGLGVCPFTSSTLSPAMIKNHLHLFCVLDQMLKNKLFFNFSPQLINIASQLIAFCNKLIVICNKRIGIDNKRIVIYNKLIVIYNKRIIICNNLMSITAKLIVTS